MAAKNGRPLDFGMSSEPPPTFLRPDEQLAALRALDIFHPWTSIDEARLCCRCGQIITGREIRVVNGPGEHRRLECPTEGCPAVPIEWMILEPPPKPDGETPAAPVAETQPPPAPAPAPVRRRATERPGFFRFPPIVPFVM